MHDMISVMAFTPFLLKNDVRISMAEDSGRRRAVMEGACLMAPLPFFSSIPGLIVEAHGKECRLSLNGHSLTATLGQSEYDLDGTRHSFITTPRLERGYACLPAKECSQALGLACEQFDQLFVVTGQSEIDKLKADHDQLDQLTRKTCGIYNASAFTSADFRSARDAWRRELCGDAQTNDLAIPGMKRLLEMRDLDSEDLRKQMNRGKDIPILFGSEPPKESIDLGTQYNRLLRMAQPYGTIGCRGYRDKALLADIIYALDWMYDNMYGANVLSDESYRSYRKYDWWHWYVGGPCPMMDTVMIIEDDLTQEQINKYLLPVSFIRTRMRVEPTEAMAMSRIITLTPLALLTEDRALLQAEYLDEESLLQEHDTGDNMRRDWCCMTHGMPYNIAYGSINLSRVAQIMHVLDHTPLAFTITKKYNLMNILRYTFAPVLYRGRELSPMNGRMMQDDAGSTAALCILRNMRCLLGLFGEAEDREIYELIYRNATSEVRDGLISSFDTGITLEKYRLINTSVLHWDEPKTHIASYHLLYDALTNDRYQTKPYTIGYMWYSGDSCVQFRNGYMAGLRMISKRSPGYESINGANGDGWYTGDGALYLYTPGDDFQYQRVWWENADKTMMPGTTVEQRPREAMFFDRAWRSSQSFVGGVDLEKEFVSASMDYESFHCEVDEGRPDRGYGRSWPIFHCTLTAKKSYFMLDRAIVLIGTEISASDGFNVRTIVDHRILKDGLNGVQINGRQITEADLGSTHEDVRSVYIPTVGGYLFPAKCGIRMATYQHGGKMFMTICIEHGVDPKNGSYVCVIKPNVPPEEIVAAQESQDISVIANDGWIQAVREEHSGLMGIIFRDAGEMGGVRADQPMIAMIRQKDEELEVVVSDPTQARDSISFSVEGTYAAQSTDPCIVLQKEADRTQLNIACDSARGRAYRAVFTKE